MLTFIHTRLAATLRSQALSQALSGARRQSLAYAAALARGASAAQAGALAGAASGAGSVGPSDATVAGLSSPLSPIEESLQPPAGLTAAAAAPQPVPSPPPPPPPPRPPQPASPPPAPAADGPHQGGKGDDALTGWEVLWQDIRLRRRIGSGSFGRVYLAHFLATPVAVKVLISRGEA